MVMVVVMTVVMGVTALGLALGARLARRDLAIDRVDGRLLRRRQHFHFTHDLVADAHRQAHGQALRGQLQELETAADTAAVSQRELALELAIVGPDDRPPGYRRRLEVRIIDHLLGGGLILEDVPTSGARFVMRLPAMEPESG